MWTTIKRCFYVQLNYSFYSICVKRINTIIKIHLNTPTGPLLDLRMIVTEEYNQQAFFNCNRSTSDLYNWSTCHLYNELASTSYMCTTFKCKRTLPIILQSELLTLANESTCRYLLLSLFWILEFRWRPMDGLGLFSTLWLNCVFSLTHSPFLFSILIDY